MTALALIGAVVAVLLWAGVFGDADLCDDEGGEG